MNCCYQGVPGAYSSIVAKQCLEHLSLEIDKMDGLKTFEAVWDQIMQGDLGILPIENSYAGNIHTNIYHFIRNDAKIIGEISLKVEHALLAKSGDIKSIKKVYSHHQALAQCHNFLKENNIEGIFYEDTAAAAKMVSESAEENIAAIASKYAGELYGLKTIESDIQDQQGNTTRFLLVVKKDSNLTYKKSIGKMTLIFETKNTPGALYKSLGCFATNNINLTKIESLPSYKNPFDYLFWIDIEGHVDNPGLKIALEELKYYTDSIRILGEY